jgi:hypothetical protein
VPPRAQASVWRQAPLDRLHLRRTRMTTGTCAADASLAGPFTMAPG